MVTLITDEELCEKVIKYDQSTETEVQCIYSSVTTENEIKVIKVEIWESEMNQADIIITAIKNGDGICSLSNNKVFKVRSFNMEIDTLQNIKREGLRIKKMLIKNFKRNGIRITSDLRYRG